MHGPSKGRDGCSAWRRSCRRRSHEVGRSVARRRDRVRIFASLGRIPGAGPIVPADGLRLAYGFTGDDDALPFANLIDVVEVELGHSDFEEAGQLLELPLDALSVASRGELIAITVLLVAGDAGGGTGGASRVFGVALRTL